MIMLTFGQAACLVLGEPPENQQEAIEYFRSSRLTVIYLYGEDPLLRPVAIGKKVQELNPYLYRAYPETIPSTPSVSSLPSIPSQTTPSTAAEIQSNSQPSTVSVQCASSGIRPPAPSSTTSCKAPLLKRNKGQFSLWFHITWLNTLFIVHRSFRGRPFPSHSREIMSIMNTIATPNDPQNGDYYAHSTQPIRTTPGDVTGA